MKLTRKPGRHYITELFLIKLSVLALSGGVLASCHHRTKPTRPDYVAVETIVAQIGDVSSSTPYSGTVEAATGSALSFSVAGTIKSVNVKEGDKVAAGQVIATMDEASLRNAWEIANATLASAQDAYNRMKILHDENSLADMQWVEVQNALKQARSAEAIAKKALSDARLVSPISGYVSDKYLDAGMAVAPGIPVVKVVTLDPVEVKISVPENEIGGIAIDRGAVVTSQSIPGKTFTGKVVERGVSANPLSRAYDVKIRLDAKSADGFLPGMICSVTLDKATSAESSDNINNIIVLPVNAVLLDADNHNFVWLDSASTAVKRMVEIAAMTDNGIAIAKGINPGDSVIVSGQQKVSHGMKVKAE